MIFGTMWKEGYGPAFEEVILTVEISLPHDQFHYLSDHYVLLIKRTEIELGCLITWHTDKTTNKINHKSLYISGGFIGTQVSFKFLSFNSLFYMFKLT